MWWLYWWNCVRALPFDNYSAVAHLIELTVSSGCPLSSPVPQWHFMCQQHDGEFRAQRIMATSYPQGSELYYSFPVSLLGQALDFGAYLRGRVEGVEVQRLAPDSEKVLTWFFMWKASSHSRRESRNTSFPFHLSLPPTISHILHLT